MEKILVLLALVSVFSALAQLQYSDYADLSAESVAEGECLKITAYPATNFTWVIQPRVFYVPMASEHYYRTYAETFLGRPVLSEEELNDMRLRLDVVYSRIANLGYDQHFVQVCLPMGGHGKINCTYVSGSPGTSAASLEMTLDTIVWTDNRTAILVVRCINGQRRNWKLAQVTPYLDPEVKNKAKEVIESLGFNTNLISYRV